MIEVTGNIWELAKPRDGIVITTNGTVKANGEAVMGRGIAKQAVMLYPPVARILGDNLRGSGNTVGFLRYEHSPKWISFPVKHNWWEKADLELIRQSATNLFDLVDENFYYDENDDAAVAWTIWVPRPGCGNGGLKWSDVKPVIEPIFDDRFTVVNYG